MSNVPLMWRAIKTFDAFAGTAIMTTSFAIARFIPRHMLNIDGALFAVGFTLGITALLLYIVEEAMKEMEATG